MDEPLEEYRAAHFLLDTQEIPEDLPLVDRIQRLVDQLTLARALARLKHEQLWSIKVTDGPVPSTNQLLDDEREHPWLKENGE